MGPNGLVLLGRSCILSMMSDALLLGVRIPNLCSKPIQLVGDNPLGFLTNFTSNLVDIFKPNLLKDQLVVYLGLMQHTSERVVADIMGHYVPKSYLSQAV